MDGNVLRINEFERLEGQGLRLHDPHLAVDCISRGQSEDGSTFLAMIGIDTQPSRWPYAWRMPGKRRCGYLSTYLREFRNHVPKIAQTSKGTSARTKALTHEIIGNMVMQW